MKPMIFALLFLACSTAHADSNALYKLEQLKAELESIQHEQQSVYQNYQMVKDLRRSEVQENSPPMAQNPYGTTVDVPPPNYDDVLRLQANRENRIQQYTADLRHLTSRFLDLDDKRRTLLKKIDDLEQRAE